MLLYCSWVLATAVIAVIAAAVPVYLTLEGCSFARLFAAAFGLAVLLAFVYLLLFWYKNVHNGDIQIAVERVFLGRQGRK